MNRRVDWNEMWIALELALVRSEATRGQIGLVRCQAFLADLEEQGVTLSPFELRRTCDLFGAAVLVKTLEGYEVADPVEWKVAATPKDG